MGRYTDGEYEVYGIEFFGRPYVAPPVPFVVKDGEYPKLVTLRFEREKGRTITVRATDESTGELIPKAWVVMKHSGGRESATATPEGDRIIEFIGNLRYRAAETVTIEVFAPGYSTVRFSVPPEQTDRIDVSLKRVGSSVRFEVMDEVTGRPVEGAKVSASSIEEDIASFSGVTDSDGHVSARLEESTYSIDVEAGGYARWSAGHFDRLSAELGDRPKVVTVKLAPARTLTILFETPAGQPQPVRIQDAWWFLEPVGMENSPRIGCLPEYRRWPDPKLKPVTDIAIAPLPSGTYRVSFACHGFFATYFEVRLDATVAETVHHLALYPADAPKTWKVDAEGLEQDSGWTGESSANLSPTRGKVVVLAGSLPPKAAAKLRNELDYDMNMGYTPDNRPQATFAIVENGSVAIDASRGAMVVSPLGPVLPLFAQGDELKADALAAGYGEIAGTVAIKDAMADAEYYLVASYIEPGQDAYANSGAPKSLINLKTGEFKVRFLPPGEYLIGVLRVTGDELAWDLFGGEHKVTVEAGRASRIDLR
ncbi:MAG: carboxypeptidase regulatory-like domain-containing protein [Planctomycetes bacterium]|nr:carboxypeptidase regulatory-like domain-containing protein [Planctomycetota bacterium]